MVKKVQPKRETVAYAYKFLQACLSKQILDAKRYAAFLDRDSLVGIDESTLDSLFQAVHMVVIQDGILGYTDEEIQAYVGGVNWTKGFRGFVPHYPPPPASKTPTTGVDGEYATKSKHIPTLQSYFATSEYTQFTVWLMGELGLSPDDKICQAVAITGSRIVPSCFGLDEYLFEIWDYCNNPTSTTRELHHFRVRITKEGKKLPILEYRSDLVYTKVKK